MEEGGGVGERKRTRVVHKKVVKRRKVQSQEDTERGVVQEMVEERQQKHSGAGETETEAPTKMTTSSTTAEQRKKMTPATHSFLSTSRFADLDINPRTKEAIQQMGFDYMTEIQAKSVVPALAGRDILGKAKTGSGKTLAFLIPVIEMLSAARFTPKNGTGAIILAPTRELAFQTYNWVRELMKDHSQTHGLIMGGANRGTEASKLLKGVNLIVATPGRLLDHLVNTRGFVYSNLQSLIIDEADRILDVGFEETMREILELLPEDRQTMLFSATQTQKVEDLVRLSLKDPVFVEAQTSDVAGMGGGGSLSSSTVATLEQGFVVVPGDQRFLVLFTFLKKNRHKKVMVFFSTCASVQFHADIFNSVGIPVMSLHGKQKQGRRTSTFMEFCNCKEGILLSTDVAARGLDIPSVDWIVQFDPPDEVTEYIHRVGRTARAGEGGRALLFLLPEELQFLKYLRQAKIPVNEYQFKKNKISNVQLQLEKLVSITYKLHVLAHEAYRSYLAAYSSHSLKDVYNVETLDLTKLCKCFGLDVPPRVQLNVMDNGKAHRLKRRNGAGGFSNPVQKSANSSTVSRTNPHGFSADNPYGEKGGTSSGGRGASSGRGGKGRGRGGFKNNSRGRR